MIARIVLSAGALGAAVAGFVVYGEMRTLAETFGFSAETTVTSLLFTAFFLSPVFLVITVAGLVSRKFDPGVPIVALAAGLLAGCFASETWLLADESRFSAEVAALRPGEFHDRGRAWPFRNAGLVFIPGRGIHATD